MGSRTKKVSESAVYRVFILYAPSEVEHSIERRQHIFVQKAVGSRRTIYAKQGVFKDWNFDRFKHAMFKVSDTSLHHEEVGPESPIYTRALKRFQLD